MRQRVAGRPEAHHQHVLAVVGQRIRPPDVERVPARQQSVNFESVAIATAHSEAAGFETSYAAIGEARHNLHCVVDFTTRSKRVCSRGEFANIAIQIYGRID